MSEYQPLRGEDRVTLVPAIIVDVEDGAAINVATAEFEGPAGSQPQRIYIRYRDSVPNGIGKAVTGGASVTEHLGGALFQEPKKGDKVLLCLNYKGGEAWEVLDWTFQSVYDALLTLKFLTNLKITAPE